MSDGFRVNSRSRSVFLAIVFCALVSIPVLFFFFSQLVEAYRFSMWEDELYGLQYSMRAHSYWDLVIRGAQGQGSPSPLDYLVNKFIDQIKESINYLGLPPHVYFRIFSNFITSLTAFMIPVYFWINLRKTSNQNVLILAAQFLILVCVPFAFLYEFQIYKYAHEIRPYALWVSIYFVSLALLLKWRTDLNYFLLISLIALSLSATTSFFQIGAMLTAFICANYLDKVPITKIAKPALKLFLIPIAISFYYCLRVGEWNYSGEQWGTWVDFYAYWEHFLVLTIPLIAIVVVCFLKQSLHLIAIGPLSFLVIYFSGPLIFWLTRSKGFFYADRQYIYYEVARPLLLLVVVECLSRLSTVRAKKWLALLLIAATIGSMLIAIRPKYLKRFQKSVVQTTQLFHGLIF